MNRDTAIDVLDRLHVAQNDFYAGGAGTRSLERLLTPTVVWTAPGGNRIAGTYRCLAEVLAYFRRLRVALIARSGWSAETSSSATETDRGAHRRHRHDPRRRTSLVHRGLYEVEDALIAA